MYIFYLVYLIHTGSVKSTFYSLLVHNTIFLAGCSNFLDFLFFPVRLPG